MYGQIIGSLISSGADIASDFINRETQKQNNKDQYESNKKLSELAYKQNIEQWNRENKYNTPAQQVARLVGAGLNPNLAYGTPGVVSSQASDSPNLSYQRYDPTAPQFDINGPALSDSLVNAFNSVFQEKALDNATRKTDAEVIKLISDSDLSKAQKEKILQDIEYKPKEYRLQELETQAQVRELNQRVVNLQLTAEEQQIINRFKDRMILSDLAEQDSRIKLNERQADLLLEEIRKKPYEIQHLIQQINTLFSQENLNNANVNLAGKSLEKLDKEIDRISTQIGIDIQSSKYFVWEHLIQPFLGTAGVIGIGTLFGRKVRTKRKSGSKTTYREKGRTTTHYNETIID